MGQHVRHVHLDSFLTDAQFINFMEHVPNLEDLIMANAQHITDTSFQHLPNYCPNIKFLILRRSGVIMRQSVQTLAHYCSQLHTLVLESEPGLSCDAFLDLSPCRLEKLAITISKMEDDDEDNDENDDDDDAMDTPTVLYLAGFHQLKLLNITSFSARFNQSIITTLTLYADWLPYLYDFSIDGCDSLTEQQAVAFLKTHPRLLVLTMEFSTFKDTFLEAIVAFLPRVESVGLSFGTGFTGYGIRKLVLGCPWLKRVQLDGCEINAQDFPEAGANCLDQDYYHSFFLDCLDSAAIKAIQGAPMNNRNEFGRHVQLTRWDFMDRVARQIIQHNDDDGDGNNRDK
ncbi:unnamed protein product [Absidia cylindrospora]